MVEHCLEGVFDFFPGDTFEESQSSEAVQLLYFWSVRERFSEATEGVFVHQSLRSSRR